MNTCPDCGKKKDDDARRCRPCSVVARGKEMRDRYWPVQERSCYFCPRGISHMHIKRAA